MFTTICKNIVSAKFCISKKWSSDQLNGDIWNLNYGILNYYDVDMLCMCFSKWDGKETAWDIIIENHEPINRGHWGMEVDELYQILLISWKSVDHEPASTTFWGLAEFLITGVDKGVFLFCSNITCFDDFAISLKIFNAEH